MTAKFRLFVVFFPGLWIPAVFGMSPATLQAELTAGKVTVIDIRSTDVYSHGHIPGAINVPASICAAKNLPPLGRVVIYDAGLGNDHLDSAASALNAKPGIKVDTLDGGYAAWESFAGENTKGRMVETRTTPMITYQQLKSNVVDDIVLVDLRNPGTNTAKAFTDLQGEFPQARVTRSPFQVAGAKKSASGDPVPPLLVLVDNGDGSAERMVHTLRANGIRRFLVLAGGEEIITRKGESGLQRSGTTLPVPAGAGVAP